MTRPVRGEGGDISLAVDPANVVNNALDTRSILNRNESIYSEKKVGSVEGPSGTGPNGERLDTVLNVTGTDSLFNPFRIFRYSKFAANQKTYSVGRHKFEYNGAYAARRTDESSEVFDNPTATQIIEWTNQKAASKAGPLYPYPYQINDFLWCKHYGKIPNNRLVTLRRYPVPVEDNLAIHQDKLPLIPIAQAVTWFGGETGNTLSSIIGTSYGFSWKDLNTSVQDVTGNEVGAGKVLDAMGLDATAEIGGISGDTIRKIAMAAVFADPNNPMQSSGYDAVLQEYDRDSYGDSGPYWNRVLGPVNVINSTKMRTEGLNNEKRITLSFEYNLRSYGRVNPKVAMLDLISNFLSLTYSSAPFYGGGIRYFRQTGYLAPSFNTDEMEKGNYLDGTMEAIGTYMQLLKDTGTKFQNFATNLDKIFTDGGGSFGQRIQDAAKEIGNTRLVNDIIGARVGPLLQAPLMMRSILDGRAVGEWHVMVGNPANPIAVIGNLCLSSTEMSFSEELGPDDFPTSVKFEVTLEQGRPRAKQDIESMFNLGGGDLTYTALADPTSAFGSYGEYTTNRMNLLNSALTNSDGSEQGVANNLASYFKNNVSRAYGPNFGASQALPDYFNQIKTKD